MRIAVLIIALFLAVIVGFQSCALGAVGGLSEDESITTEAGSGIIVLFLFIFGAAFVMTYPKVSMVIFVIAGVIGLISSPETFKDLQIWGGLAFILALMSYFGSRELKKKKMLETSRRETTSSKL